MLANCRTRGMHIYANDAAQWRDLVPEMAGMERQTATLPTIIRRSGRQPDRISNIAGWLVSTATCGNGRMNGRSCVLVHG